MNDVVTTRCKNCDFAISGKFCSNCGQKSSVGKITAKETAQDFIDMVFSVNAPLALTLKLLIVNPGKLFSGFLHGQRKKFYKPVPFFILTTVVFMLLKSLLNYDPMANMAAVGNENMDLTLINRAGVYMAKNVNNIVFIFVFSFAFMMKLFFYRKYSFIEYLAISFYIIGFYMFATTVFMFGLKYLDPQYKMVPFIFMFFYVVYALLSFFKKISIGMVLKIFFAFFIALNLYIIFGYGFSFLIVWLKSM